MNLEPLVEALHARQLGNGQYQGRCPAHDDEHASLTFTERDGKLLVHCQARCSQGAVISALKGRGLWPTTNGAGHKRITATYDYLDEKRALLYQVVRYEPKGFSQRRPNGNDGWIYSLNGVRRIPYRLPELLAADVKLPVFVVEGEKDADALAKLGLTATTNPGGAGKWRDDYSAALKDRCVVILPDNDEAGGKHAREVAQALLSVAQSVRIVRLPELPPKGDVVDWIAHGGTKEKLIELVNAEPPFAAADDASNPWARAQTARDFLQAETTDPKWIVRDVLAPGTVTFFASPRGLGKTHVAHALAIAVATGGAFRGEAVMPGRVLLIDRDNPKREIRRRLRAWGAESADDKLHLLTRDDAPPLTDAAAWAQFPLAAYSLVVLDSISAATEGVDEKEGGKSGAALAPLIDLARRGPAVLVLANTRRDGTAIRGSGVQGDRADILYEVRDATELKLEPKHSVWWDALPEAGDHAWGDKAKRRRQRDDYRLAFLGSKFRVGEEPKPWAVEARLGESWELVDETAELEQTLENTKRAAGETEELRRDAAVAALKAALPLQKTPNATDLLIASGLGRNSARQLIADRMGRDWESTGTGKRNDPYVLVRVEVSAGKNGIENTTEIVSPDNPFLATTGAEGRQETTSQSDCAPMTLASPVSRRSILYNADQERF